jgi:hypothetical protein
MQVCTVFNNGTTSEPSNGGFGGDLGLTPNSPPKPPSHGWSRSIGKVPSKGNWVVIAENGGWWLRLNADTRHAAWQSIKLGSKVVRAGGSNFSLSWNGQRFANTSELRLLMERFPEAAEWVIEQLGLGNVR